MSSENQLLNPEPHTSSGSLVDLAEQYPTVSQDQFTRIEAILKGPPAPPTDATAELPSQESPYVSIIESREPTDVPAHVITRMRRRIRKEAHGKGHDEKIIDQAARLATKYNLTTQEALREAHYQASVRNARETAQPAPDLPRPPRDDESEATRRPPRLPDNIVEDDTGNAGEATDVPEPAELTLEQRLSAAAGRDIQRYAHNEENVYTVFYTNPEGHFMSMMVTLPEQDHHESDSTHHPNDLNLQTDHTSADSHRLDSTRHEAPELDAPPSKPEEDSHEDKEAITREVVVGNYLNNSEHGQDAVVAKSIAPGCGLIASVDGVSTGEQYSTQATGFALNELNTITFDHLPTSLEATHAIEIAFARAATKIRDLQAVHTHDFARPDSIDVVATAAMMAEEEGNTILLVAHVGDSRLYDFNPQSGEVRQITRDDSWIENHGKPLLKSNFINNPHDLYTHEKAQSVTKMVGDVRSTSDITWYGLPFEDGHVYFTSTDGYHDQVDTPIGLPPSEKPNHPDVLTEAYKIATQSGIFDPQVFARHLGQEADRLARDTRLQPPYIKGPDDIGISVIGTVDNSPTDEVRSVPPTPVPEQQTPSVPSEAPTKKNNGVARRTVLKAGIVTVGAMLGLGYDAKNTAIDNPQPPPAIQIPVPPSETLVPPAATPNAPRSTETPAPPDHKERPPTATPESEQSEPSLITWLKNNVFTYPPNEWPGRFINVPTVNGEDVETKVTWDVNDQGERTYGDKVVRDHETFEKNMRRISENYPDIVPPGFEIDFDKVRQLSNFQSSIRTQISTAGDWIESLDLSDEQKNMLKYIKIFGTISSTTHPDSEHPREPFPTILLS